MRRLAALLSVALLLAAGCSATPTKPTASPSHPPVDGGRYQSGADLAAAVNHAGLVCSDYHPETFPGSTALEVGSCSLDGDPARFVQVRIYAGTQDAAVDMRQWPPFSRPPTFLVGQNWTLNLGEPTVATKLKAALGGNLLTPGSPN